MKQRTFDQNEADRPRSGRNGPSDPRQGRNGRGQPRRAAREQRSLVPVEGRLHVAIIMDGNGRWATRRRLPRAEGHRAGAGAVRRIVEASPSLGITDLTLYAFSSDNWERPALEVSALMRLFGEYLERETVRCVAEGVRMSVVGRRDRLPVGLRRAIARSEAATEAGRALNLRLAIDYSARDALVGAAMRLAAGTAQLRPRGSPGPLPLQAATRDRFARALADELGVREPVPDVDLMIRSGGERRLSDFLLWECAYAELYFTARAWPDFGRGDLELALEDYRKRDRRFGLVAGEEVAV